MPSIRLFGTGFDSNGTQLTSGQDCNWSVCGGGLAGLISPLLVSSNNLNGGWVRPSEDGPPFSWIWMNADGNGTTPDGNPCIFEQVFDLSNCDLSSVVLNLNLAGDDNAQLRLNGQNVLDTPGDGWSGLVSRTINGPANFIQGLNSLTISVPNGSGQGGLACAASCTANPTPPAPPTNSGHTFTFPLIIPPASQSYTLPGVAVPSNATLPLSGIAPNYDSNAFPSSPATVSATLQSDPNNPQQKLLTISVAALDQPLRYRTSGDVVPANASVTVTISTSGK